MCLKTERYSNRPVHQEEDRPGDEEDDGIREHHRNESADTGIFYIALAEYHHKREVREQRCNNVGYRITHAIGCLG